VEASKAQKSALSSILARLDEAAAVVDDLQRQLKRANQRIDDLSADSTDSIRKMAYEVASLRGSVAANTRWSTSQAEKRIFLTAEELQLAQMFGLSEKDFAQQKTIAEGLGVDLTALLKKRRDAHKGSPT